MKESFLNKAKADLKVIGKTANFATQFTKYKIEIQAKKQEKERLLKQIGQSIYDLHKAHSTFKSAEVMTTCGDDFEKYRQLDDEITSLEEMITQAKSNFKDGPSGGNASDASTESGGTHS